MYTTHIHFFTNLDLFYR